MGSLCQGNARRADGSPVSAGRTPHFSFVQRSRTPEVTRASGRTSNQAACPGRLRTGWLGPYCEEQSVLLTRLLLLATLAACGCIAGWDQATRHLTLADRLGRLHFANSRLANVKLILCHRGPWLLSFGLLRHQGFHQNLGLGLDRTETW